MSMFRRKSHPIGASPLRGLGDYIPGGPGVDPGGGVTSFLVAPTTTSSPWLNTGISSPTDPYYPPPPPPKQPDGPTGVAVNTGTGCAKFNDPAQNRACVQSAINQAGVIVQTAESIYARVKNIATQLAPTRDQDLVSASKLLTMIKAFYESLREPFLCCDKAERIPPSMQNLLNQMRDIDAQATNALKCPNPMIRSGNKCVCPAGMTISKDGTQCFKPCEPGRHRDPNTEFCVSDCKDGFTWVKGNCVDNNNLLKEKSSKAGMVFPGGSGGGGGGYSDGGESYGEMPLLDFNSLFPNDQDFSIPDLPPFELPENPGLNIDPGILDPGTNTTYGSNVGGGGGGDISIPTDGSLVGGGVNANPSARSKIPWVLLAVAGVAAMAFSGKSKGGKKTASKKNRR